MNSFQGGQVLETLEKKEYTLEDLMELYGNDLKRIAFLYVNDHGQCEDIIQEVFLSCYKNMESFRHESNYKTWLIRITINKCKDYRKKWSIKNMIYKPFIDPFMKNKGPSSEENLLRKEIQNDMIHALAKLPSKYKDVLILYYYQDMKVDEIASLLKANPNTIRSQLTRGRILLKKKWKGD
ncbi:sigma-70 family RNA polymerase sigma factor [Sutcliffiella horikoshii]|uniref:Sigma-70 family RNA polymerase sigma factor n=1 Tax=Sutcliffiella horikoshii TaxID=79883 RepID=A0A5D4T9G1_9BACI|nr:sigma-70 family RNA polymerase sigma factor [Sutcliffiella horikoshii]TYS72330.1 sigma-70 family RNA polymerase sigma factor [Sutcliffiella horikoshii]